MRDIRTYARCGSHVVELTAERPLTVGRAADCDLVLDDELSSRHHFRIELAGDRVEVVDLGSRNGILVNGLRVEGRQELHHGDLITAGRSQVSLSRQAHRPRTESLEDFEAIGGGRDRPESGEQTESGNVFDILGGSARMSLDDGDVSAAERSASNLFVAIRSSLSRRRPTSETIFEDAVDLALRLVEPTGDVGWVDRVLELHVAAERPMTSALTDRVLAAARGSGQVPRALDDYLAFARARGDANAERLAPLAS